MGQNTIKYESPDISDSALLVLRDTHRMILQNGRVKLYPHSPFLSAQLKLTHFFTY